jgi:hypothetical protein
VLEVVVTQSDDRQQIGERWGETVPALLGFARMRVAMIAFVSPLRESRGFGKAHVQLHGPQPWDDEEAAESPPAESATPRVGKPSARAVRGRLARDAEALYEEKIQAFFEDALSADRKVWAGCPNGRKRHEVDVPDWQARAKVLELLLNQGYGRPKAEDETGAEPFILTRRIVLPSGFEVDEAAFQDWLASRELGAASHSPSP